MITLITGGPGTGKTAWLLNQLLDLIKNEPERLLFIHGVRNLRGIRHETIYCRSQLCDICRAQDAQIIERSKTDNPPKYVEDWPRWKEANALIVVDEVQRIWRPTNGAQGPSEAISALETHRHYGVDFWLISQGPHLFHNFIRLLVGRHIHLVAKWHGRKEFEWPECKQDIQSRSDAVERSYQLPKRVYSLYDSAEVHTKQDKRKPLAFYAVSVFMLLAVVLFGFAYQRISSRTVKQDPATNTQLSVGVEGAAGAAGAAGQSSPAIMNAEQLNEQYTPIVPGVPWSAPIYRELAKPLTMPRIVGCIKSNKFNDYRCACYTQQSTIVEVSQEVCTLLVQHRAFNPFKSDDQRQPQIENTVSAVEKS